MALLPRQLGPAWYGLECMLQNSHAQHGEDLALLAKLLEATDGQPGTFVEIGAFDGVTYSNTLTLELCFNWTGVLIEANPANYARLQANRRRRPRSKVIHAAVCDDDDESHSVRITRAGAAVAGQLDLMAPKFRRRWAERHQLDQNGTVHVPCRSLTSLMRTAGLER